MSQPHIHPLVWADNPADWLARLRPLGDAVWLDSGRLHRTDPQGGTRGRFDIIAAAPVATVVTRRGDGRDPLALLRTALRDQLAPLAPHPALPFQGGAIGLLGYDALALPTVTAPTAPALPFPDAWFGIYRWAVVCDHQRRRAQLVCHPSVSATLQRELFDRLRQPVAGTDQRFRCSTAWRARPDGEDYRAAFAKVRDYVAAGDCYQVNLARHWQCRYEGDPWEAYLRLRERAAAPFGAWLETPFGQVLCQSPERFLHCREQALWTQPIKGTAPRGATPEMDRRLGDALLASAKNQAENLMIVDLLRNDFGRVCAFGCIKVDRLFELQRFPTVQHLVSSVRGRLCDGLDPLDALQHCFPGGSITGAPKLRAMQIIGELEPFRRSIFCGSIGYLSACGEMDMNIAIRTLLAVDGHLHAWAGGGIVADSDCAEELAETEAKIEPLLAALRDEQASRPPSATATPERLGDRQPASTPDPREG